MRHPDENTPTLSQEQENKFLLERLAKQLNAAPNFKDIDNNQREMYETFEKSAKWYFNELLKLQGKGVEVLCRTIKTDVEPPPLQILTTPEIENAETRGRISVVVNPETTYPVDGMSTSTTSIMCGLDTSAATALMRYVASASDMKELKDVLDEAKKHGNEAGGIGIYLLRLSLGKRAIRIVMLAILDDEKRDMIAVHRGVVRNNEESPHEYYVVPFEGNNIEALQGFVDYMFKQKMGPMWEIKKMVASAAWQLAAALREDSGNVFP